MTTIPDSSNFYCSLYTSLSREQVAGFYRPLGWEIRKCNWVDYEIVSLWAELVIEADAPIVMHGSVALVLNNAALILAPLRHAGITYTAECYEDAKLIGTFTWSPV